LKYALPASIFFFKFLEWWYSSDNPRRRRNANSGSGEGGEEGKAGFGAPKVLKPHSKGCLYVKDPKWKDLKVPTTGDGNEKTLLHNSCPLCGVSPINNPAILETGYVFCYTCAFEYLEEKGKCPVTLMRVEGGGGSLRKVLG